ncbi:MAG: hypothetical protein RLZZ488_1835 [Pseudomonadota bacterium]
MVFLSAFASLKAQGHARWKAGSSVSAPRSEDSGLKTAPCGGTSRTANVKKYTAGESVTLEFEETINHPGYYEVHLLGANDQKVAGVPSPLAKLDDTQNNPIRNGNNHQYKITFQVPAVDCPECAFQLIQVMLDNPNAPSNYYSCTDVSISNSDKAPAKPAGFKIQRRK